MTTPEQRYTWTCLDVHMGQPCLPRYYVHKVGGCVHGVEVTCRMDAALLAAMLNELTDEQIARARSKALEEVQNAA